MFANLGSHWKCILQDELKICWKNVATSYFIIACKYVFLMFCLCSLLDHRIDLFICAYPLNRFSLIWSELSFDLWEVAALYSIWMFKVTYQTQATKSLFYYIVDCFVGHCCLSNNLFLSIKDLMNLVLNVKRPLWLLYYCGWCLLILVLCLDKLLQKTYSSFHFWWIPIENWIECMAF